MDLNDLLVRYFGTDDPAHMPADTLAAGLERMRVDFGLEKDRGCHFALWSLMHVLGNAPDLDTALKHEADREAARNLMDLADRAHGP